MSDVKDSELWFEADLQPHPCQKKPPKKHQKKSKAGSASMIIINNILLDGFLWIKIRMSHS